jgi:TonB-dependent receptor
MQIPLCISLDGRRRLARSLLVAVAFLFLCFSARAADGGLIVGTVSNSATSNLLEGAHVEIPKLGLITTADHTGQFRLSNVPAGDYELQASYTGLDTERKTVHVDANGSVTANFGLSSSTYRLDKFVVSGPREGSAAAITAQRNADNVKNVVSMDFFGSMPNMSAGEVAIRLPGVAGQLDDENNVTGLIIRGQSSANNRVEVDGFLLASSAGASRQFQTHSLTGAMFEQLEVVKGHLPDQSSDSLGGSVNMITRSPLSMAEDQRFDYNVGVRFAPSFTAQDPLRRDHPSHPLINASYQRVYSVLGGERNLGIAVNAFYSENVAGYFTTQRDFQNTTAQPAYLWDYRTSDNFNNRKQSSLNLKVDYRISPTTKVSVTGIYNDAFEPFNRLYVARAFTSQTVATLDANGNPTGTGAILPSYTSTVTQVRGVAASTMDLNETMFSFMNRWRTVIGTVEHNFDRWHIDYAASYSQAHENLGVGNGGTVSNDLTGIGWKLDRTQNDLFPKFTQTEGPDMTNIANYKPGQLTTRNGKRNNENTAYRANVKYDLPFEYHFYLKAGFAYEKQLFGTVTDNRRWNYTSTKPLAVNPSFVSYDQQKTGRTLPWFESSTLINDNHPVDPTLWSEDAYFRDSSQFSGTNSLTEDDYAGYLMTQGKIGKFGIVAGLRSEKTDVDAFGYVRAHTLTTAAQQVADPVGSALKDYGNNAKDNLSSYTKYFPSVHTSYDITSNLKARATYSTSFGRPPPGSLTPNETPNDTTQQLTVNNQNLRPQLATNWDATLEYYFEPVGSFTVGWFHKEIKDYIISGQQLGTVATGADNGYNGQYAGYTIITSVNASSAVAEGFESAYQQQFTFLPGLWRGLGLSLNYTYLRSHGLFAGTTYLTSNQVQGFIPQTGNANLYWRFHGFTARIRANYTGRYINAFSTTPGRNEYRFARTITDLDFSYDIRRGASLFLTVSNLTNEPQKFYRFVTSQMDREVLDGTTISTGVTGRF